MDEIRQSILREQEARKARLSAMLNTSFDENDKKNDNKEDEIEKEVKKSESDEFNKAYSDLFEKAKHQIGDSHPKWPQLKWTDLGGGKFGWRTGTGRGKRAKVADQASSSNTSNSGGSTSQADYAKETDTKTLKNVVNSDKAPKDLKDAAKKELQNRGETTQKKETDEDIQKQIDDLKKKIEELENLKITSDDESYMRFRLAFQRVLLKNAKKVLEEALQDRPEAKATIAKLQKDLTQFISSEQALEDTKKDDKKLRPVGTGTNGPERRRKSTKTFKVPKGKRISAEDDIVEVYDDKGKKVYSGILDYCPYKDDNFKWNEKDGNYDLPKGYKMVGK